MKLQDKLNNEKFLPDERSRNIEEIEKLLDLAENCEREINNLKGRNDLLRISLVFLLLIAPFLGLLIVAENTFVAEKNHVAVGVFASIFFLGVSIVNINRMSSVYEALSKEKRAYRRVVGVVQEVLPYYLLEMSVLERVRFEVRLAKLDIVDTKEGE